MGNVRARMEARVKERGGGGESAGTSLSLRAIPGREECDCQGLRESAQTFGVILQIFVDVPCRHCDCGSDVWAAIFTKYPSQWRHGTSTPLIGPSVTHKLIARSLQSLLAHHRPAHTTDSQDEFVKHMER